MAVWRLAKSLGTLRDEINQAAPHRSKASDGTIGNQEHAARSSRHNPSPDGVVCAMDVTNDPAGGCPIHVLVRQLVAGLAAGTRETNPDLEYIISNRQVASRTSGWKWKAYTGTNPHEHHAHFGVGRGPDSAPAFPYDDTIPWNLFTTSASAAPVPKEDDDMPKVYKLDSDTTVEGTAYKAGFTYLLIGNVRRHLEPGTDVDETIRQHGPAESVNAVAFGHHMASTALDMAGMRSMPPAQYGNLITLVQGIVSGDLSAAEIERAVKNVLKGGVG